MQLITPNKPSMLVPFVGIAIACFLSFGVGLWAADKSQRHVYPAPDWRNACSLTDASGNPSFLRAPAEKLAQQ